MRSLGYGRKKECVGGQEHVAAVGVECRNGGVRLTLLGWGTQW